MDEISSPSQQLQQLPITTTTKTIKEKQLSSPRRQGTGRAAVLPPPPPAPLPPPAPCRAAVLPCRHHFYVAATARSRLFPASLFPHPYFFPDLIVSTGTNTTGSAIGTLPLLTSTNTSGSPIIWLPEGVCRREFAGEKVCRSMRSGC
ncbi:unnamed protein product [Linum trigynum]|uniref:Uncharacterized protein n=1 Tax=Linum trigynum TaxID=586398 RepID=A0AAV2D626_9ROSI